MRTQLVGAFLALAGVLGTVVVCLLPMWKVTSFSGAHLVTLQVSWEGLWMNCVTTPSLLRCEAYDPHLVLPVDLLVSRVLICVSIAAGVVGIGLDVVGARCTNFLGDEPQIKSTVVMAAGVLFMLAGVLCLMAVCWLVDSIFTGSFNPLHMKDGTGALGASGYVGGASAALLLIGGGILCITDAEDEGYMLLRMKSEEFTVMDFI